MRGEKVNDFDVYFKNYEVMRKVLLFYMKMLYRLNGGMAGDTVDVETILKCETPIKLERNRKAINEVYIPKMITENAITLSNSVQIVTRFTGLISSIIGNFDFAHTKVYYDYEKDYLFYSLKSLRAILDKRLVYIGSSYPLTSVMRLRKFIKRGWSINAGEILKILFQVSKLNLEDREVLREQLIGVDVLYFDKLIEELRYNKRNITENILWDLIDKIF